MCGFVGFVAYQRERLPSTAWIRSMLDLIAHRGPDDDGVSVDEDAALGFRRLAILDLSAAGHQPMTTHDGVHSIVFNGEIYNYVELRHQLASLGHRFVSTGDTEVLLAAYRQWGTACVDRLVGMFAFCIVDRRSGTTFIARDRFGIKPLFYLRHADGVLLSSELKCIRASGLWDGTLNLERFSRFLSFGTTEGVDEDSDTYLAGVHQLPAAHSCVIGSDGRMRIERYWTPQQGEHIPAKRVIDEFRAAFDDSIALHMRSDVPVGVMLSGGMDSGSIACAMAARGSTDLHAFSYVTPAFDETEQLNDVLQQTGATHHVTHGLDPENFWTRLRQLVWHHDEPVHSASALMGFELYRMAAVNGIKVVLCGQGADESLGGYYDQADHVLVTEALRGRWVSMYRQAQHIAALSSRSVPVVLKRTAIMLRSHALAGRASYRQAAALRRLTGGHGRQYLSPAMQELAVPVHDSAGGQTLDQALIRSIVASPLPHYLRAEDRNSMANGVEARLPFLDHRLVELAMRLPPRWKMYDGWNKQVLRQAMKDRIPDSVRFKRQKLGFPTAAAEWFAGPLAGGLRDIVEDSAIMRTGWFDPRTVRQALGNHQQGRLATKLLFNIAQLDSWYTLHQDGWPKPVRHTPLWVAAIPATARRV